MLPTRNWCDFCANVKLSLQLLLLPMMAVNVKVVVPKTFHSFVCCRVLEHSDSNRMTTQNIGIVFGPTLMRPERDNGNMAVNMVYQNQAVEFILSEFDHIFGTRGRSWSFWTWFWRCGVMWRGGVKKKAPADQTKTQVVQCLSPMPVDSYGVKWIFTSNDNYGVKRTRTESC